MAFGNGSAIPSIACRTMLPFHEAWSQVNDQGCTLAFNGSVALGKYQKRKMLVLVQNAIQTEMNSSLQGCRKLL